RVRRPHSPRSSAGRARSPRAIPARIGAVPSAPATGEAGVPACYCPMVGSGTVTSLVPARMDRLPWCRFHTRVVVALGVAWVLDGLEITVASLIGPVLQSRHTLALSSVDVGRAASVYLVG